MTTENMDVALEGDNNKKKKIVAAVAAGGVALTAGVFALNTNGTLAQWFDTAQGAGGTITAGELKVDTVDAPTWVNASHGNAAIADLDAYRVVPGDLLQGTQKVDVTMVGDTLEAEFNVDAFNASGDLLTADDIAGVKLTYDILDPSGISVGSGVVGEAAGAPVTLDKAQTAAAEDYSVRINADFLDDTMGQDRQEAQAILDNLNVRVNQINLR